MVSSNFFILGGALNTQFAKDLPRVSIVTLGI